MVAMPVEESWQDGDGGVATVATSKGGGLPCRQVSLFRLWQLLAFTQHKQLSYTAHIHSALGGGGPRWRPLNVAVAMSQWRNASGKVPGRRQRRWRHMVGTGRWQHFIIGWWAGGGSMAVAAFAPRWILNFVILICIFSIRPFSYIVNIRPLNQHFHTNWNVKIRPIFI
jgi:hypothetical protein